MVSFDLITFLGGEEKIKPISRGQLLCYLGESTEAGVCILFTLSDRNLSLGELATANIVCI